MNSYKILILFSLVFVIIGAVSAANNITDTNSTQNDVLGEPKDLAGDINVTFEEQMWVENLSDIDVELPEEASGEFCIRINDEAIYNQTITDHTFKVPIKLPQPKFIVIANIYPPMDMKTYKVSAFYNGIDLNITKTLKVMSYPPYYDFISFPQEILYQGENPAMMVFPRSANGTVEFYIDDRLFERAAARPIFTWDKNPFSNLDLGNHTLRVSYLGDSYYRPFNRTFNFTVSDVVISIPQTVNIGHDDCISLKAATTAPANVKVYLDNRLVADSKAYNGEYLLSLEGLIRYTDHEVLVVYEAKGISRTKIQQVNMTYDFDVWPMAFTYANDNRIELTLPDTLNNNLLTVKINGTQYAFRHEENMANNIVEVDISGLDAGNYSMTVSFRGDEWFYPLERTYNFTIGYNFHIPDEVEYMDSSKVYLRLPGDADGDLMVYVDGKLFKTSKLNKGYAEVRIDSLAPGDYQITARYTGRDYEIAEVNSSFYVLPKISLTYRFTEGEDKYVTVEVPKDCKGHVVFNIDDITYKVSIINGIARLSLKSLKAGEHDIYIDYYGDNGFEELDQWRVVTVYKAKIKPVTTEVTFKGVNVKVKLLTRDGKPLSSKTVTVKFNGKTYKLKTDKNGILTFKKSMNLKKKKYSLKITYMKSKLTKKLKVKPISLKAKKTKSKIILKATINKKAKNQIVRFKINSKTFRVQTNAKGIAKLAVKRPKGAVKIKATYMKSTVRI